MRLIDSHAHLQAQPFEADRSAVVEAAFGAGVERLMVPGWDAGSSARAVAMAEADARLDAAVGIHPHDAAAAGDGDWARIVELARDARVVAIGETGLDYDRMHSPREAQLAGLRRHLRLALETGKPAVLHCRSAAGSRDAQDDLLAEMRAAGFGGQAAAASFGRRPPAMLHSYSGPVDYARAALDMGLAISFSGLVFRHGEEASVQVAALVPEGSFLVETDSPYLAPPGVPRHSGPGFSGRRNAPEWVRVTAEWLCERRGAGPDSIGASLVTAYDATFGRRSRG